METNTSSSPSSKKQKETASDKIIQIFKKAAEKSTNVTGFILAFEQNGLLTTHFEHMPMQSASRAAISIFRQLCQMESSSKTSSTEYRRLMGELEQDFVRLIAQSNKKLDSLRGNESGKTKTT